MVVVIVAEEHDVDTREILPPDPRTSSAARPHPGQRAGSLRPDGIGQNVRGALLQEHR